VLAWTGLFGGNVYCRKATSKSAPFATAQRVGTRNFKTNIDTKTETETYQPHDDLPEWHHPIVDSSIARSTGAQGSVGRPPSRLLVGQSAASLGMTTVSKTKNQERKEPAALH
jgi:hypothetical protein